MIGGSDLLLSGFGKFNVREKSSRKGRNSQTGEDLILEGRRVVTFKPSEILGTKANDTPIMAAKDRYSIRIECPECGEQGTLHLSEERLPIY